MRPISHRLVALAMAAGLAGPAMVMAAPQGDVWVHHDHSATAPVQSAAPSDTRRDMMARMMALDERIKNLTTDMNMFIGDMKVQAMAKLLNAMVERQTMMRDEVMPMMREGMMKKMESMMNMESMMKGRSMMPGAPPNMAPEDEAGGMCAPNTAGSW